MYLRTPRSVPDLYHFEEEIEVIGTKAMTPDINKFAISDTVTTLDGLVRKIIGSHSYYEKSERDNKILIFWNLLGKIRPFKCFSTYMQ